MVLFDGEELIAGAVFTVSVAALDVAAGEQVPETMHWYLYPLFAATVELTFNVADVQFE